MDYKKSESKWQKYWRDQKIFNKDINSFSNPYYVLTMFPYPSGDKLHMGHWYQYGLVDSWSRFQTLQGKEVYQPMGFDSFGLPAENYAIKTGTHPKISTTNNIEHMKKQFKSMGNAYHWDSYLSTSDESYYKWSQWLFIQLYKHNLAEKKLAPVNWCDQCKTVLANEQVVHGKCERCESDVSLEKKEQWFFKISKYADSLLDNLESLNWPESTKAMQKSWIGKEEGFEAILYSNQVEIPIFIASKEDFKSRNILLISPDYYLKYENVFNENRQVRNFCESISKVSERARSMTKDIKGIETGTAFFDPVYKRYLPVVVANYLTNEYDGIRFAKPEKNKKDNHLINKALTLNYEFDGREKPGTDEHPISKKVIWKLRDWLVSRQRYWGVPIPVIYCDECGIQTVPEDQLPVKLPEDVKFSPEGTSPLNQHEAFKNTICPSCKSHATREVDTLDTFVCSSWYYLRFFDNGNKDTPFDSRKEKKFCPIDQ